jgi:hypothetical protein
VILQGGSEIRPYGIVLEDGANVGGGLTPARLHPVILQGGSEIRPYGIVMPAFNSNRKSVIGNVLI